MQTSAQRALTIGLGAVILACAPAFAGEPLTMPGSPTTGTLHSAPVTNSVAFEPSTPGSALPFPTSSGSGLFLSKRSLLVMGGLGLAAGIATHNRDPEGMARLIDRSGLDLLVDVGNEFGDGLPLGVGAAGLLMSGRVFGSERMSTAGGDMARSLLWSGAIVWSLKLAINAKRPDGGRHSFPSGHIASAFSVAPVIAQQWGPKAGACAFVLATGTALGRMEDRRHHLSDVLFGAAIGLAVGYEVARDDQGGILGGLSRLLAPFTISHQGLALSMTF